MPYCNFCNILLTDSALDGDPGTDSVLDHNKDHDLDLDITQKGFRFQVILSGLMRVLIRVDSAIYLDNDPDYVLELDQDPNPDSTLDLHRLDPDLQEDIYGDPYLYSPLELQRGY